MYAAAYVVVFVGEVIQVTALVVVVVAVVVVVGGQPVESVRWNY